MKTATTWIRTEKGWEGLYGPDVPANKQRHEVNRIGHNWPTGVLEIYFQMEGGKPRRWSQQKAESVATRTAIANKLAEEQAKKAQEQQEARSHGHHAQPEEAKADDGKKPKKDKDKKSSE